LKKNHDFRRKSKNGSKSIKIDPKRPQNGPKPAQTVQNGQKWPFFAPDYWEKLGFGGVDTLPGTHSAGRGGVAGSADRTGSGGGPEGSERGSTTMLNIFLIAEIFLKTVKKCDFL